MLFFRVCFFFFQVLLGTSGSHLAAFKLCYFNEPWEIKSFTMHNIMYTRDVFLLCMSVIYLIAFSSLYVQIPGNFTKVISFRPSQIKWHLARSSHRWKEMLKIFTALHKNSKHTLRVQLLTLKLDCQNLNSFLVILCSWQMICHRLSQSP